MRCMDDVSGKLGTLSVDGWTTCSHDPVLAVGLFVNQDSYFLDAIDTNGVSHTAENLLTAVTAAIQKAEETMQVSIVGFVTDSASNMVRCRELLAEKRPQTISVGCQAHWMNLLAKDIVQLAEAVMDKITNILTFFSRNGSAHAALRGRQLTLPPMPGDTRWSSHFAALDWYNRDWAAHVEVRAPPFFPLLISFYSSDLRQFTAAWGASAQRH